MAKNWLFALILSLSLPPAITVRGQDVAPVRDKYTLLTMEYNMRPLTLYRGQFQANAGYKFAVRTKSFDSQGDKISLKENGSASILHNYFLCLKYGITDFIEIGAETNYSRHGIRSESLTYLSSSDNISVNTLSETKGMSDILIQTTLRLPFEYKWYDFGLRGGIYLPTARYKPLQPTHTVTDIISANKYTVNYHFNNTNGYGVPVYQISAAAKFTYGVLSLEACGTFKKPVKEGNSIRWSQALVGTTFSYYITPYQYLLSTALTINASVHYQAAGWFDIYLNGNYFKTDGGWTDYWGVKYANPEISLFTLEPGVEIQISPSFTIYQIAGFPLTGKSTDATFYMFTMASFNIFPFFR
jgi:hypothetical protein